jgi:tetratricopeptide (TPR) repeat protein
MIVKNEEKNLEQCLNSVKSIVDEIIIVDTGSTDKTVEMAKSFNAKIFNHKWNDDFSEARNISLKHATKDWILVLDADEVIAKEDLKKIKELTEQKDVDGFSIIQRNYTDDQSVLNWQKSDDYKEAKDYPGFFPSNLVRLFRNNKGFLFENKVHEVVENSIRNSDGNIVYTDIPIHHYGHGDKEAKEQKRDKYLKIGLEEIKRNPKDPKPYFDVGLIYQKQNNPDKTIEYLKKAIELNPKYQFAHTNLGSAYLNKDMLKEATVAFEQAIKNNDKDIGAYSNLSIVYLHQNNFNKSAEVLERALKINPEEPEILNNVGVIYSQIGENKKAIEFFKKSLKVNPKKESALRNLGVIYFRKKDYPEAEKIFKKIIEFYPDSASGYSSLGIVLLLQNKSEEAEEPLNKAIKLNPNNRDAYNNLACISEVKKDFKKAIEFYNKAIELDHPNKKNIVKKIDELKKKCQQ